MTRPQGALVGIACCAFPLGFLMGLKTVADFLYDIGGLRLVNLVFGVVMLVGYALFGWYRLGESGGGE